LPPKHPLKAKQNLFSSGAYGIKGTYFLGADLREEDRPDDGISSVSMVQATDEDQLRVPCLVLCKEYISQCHIIFLLQLD